MIRGEGPRPTIATVTNRQLARIHAALRIRLKLRQEDVAREAGIGRWKVYRLEAAKLDSLRLADIRKSFEALGARIDLTASYRGAELERILDHVHPRLVASVLQVLSSHAWEARVEVTFQMRGERGSIDILGWHAETRTLLVIEIKSELPGVDPVLRPLDMKVRLAPLIARQRFGWSAARVSRLLVLPEDSYTRRLVRRHNFVITQAFPVASREVRRWLREPSSEISGIWFLSLARSASGVRNPSSIRRVQRPRTRAAHAQTRVQRADLRLIDPHKVGQLGD